jgi:hypothetical protein
MDEHLRAVLLDALESMAEVVAGVVERLAQEPLHAVPGSVDLRQADLGDHAPLAVERDAPLAIDAEVAHARAALLERLDQLRVRGDAGAAPDQFHRRTLVHIDVPADLL